MKMLSQPWHGKLTVEMLMSRQQRQWLKIWGTQVNSAISDRNVSRFSCTSNLPSDKLPQLVAIKEYSLFFMPAIPRDGLQIPSLPALGWYHLNRRIRRSEALRFFFCVRSAYRVCLAFTVFSLERSYLFTLILTSLFYFWAFSTDRKSRLRHTAAVFFTINFVFRDASLL